MKKFFEILFAIALFCITYYVYEGQERIRHNSNQGCDGSYYYKSIEQVVNDEFPIIGSKPFVNRIGLHYTVGWYTKLTGYDIIESTMQVNLIALFFTVILLVIWLKMMNVNLGMRLFLICFYLLTWHSGVRNLFFDTIVPDPWGGVFFLLGIISMQVIKKRFLNSKLVLFHLLLLSFFVFIGTLFRESMIAFAICILFISSPLSFQQTGLLKVLRSYNYYRIKKYFSFLITEIFRKKNLILCIPFIGAVGAKLLTAYCVSSEGVTGYFSNYSYPKALAQWFYSKSLPEFLVGVFLSYGPLVLLLLFFIKDIKKWFHGRDELLILFAFGVFFGYFGGGDTERILYMSTFPIVFIFFAIAINKVWNGHKLLLLLMLFLQTFAYRIYWDIPNYPNNYETIPIPFWGLIGEKFNSLYLYATHGNMFLNSLLFFEYIFLLLIIFLVLKKDKIFHKDRR